MFLLNFFLSPVGKIVGYVLGGLAAIGIVWGIITYHDSQVKKIALYEYNKRQLEQTIKDKADEVLKLQNLNNYQNDLLSTVQKQNDEVNKGTDNIKTYLSTLPKSDPSVDPVSPVILETLKKLKELDK